jgi:protein-tyrosine-phosphatase
VVAVSEPVDATLSSYAVRLLRALGWQGVAMVEFRQDLGSERLALMEVNGRFWGSIALAGHAGIEFPYYAWQAAHGICPDSVNSYKRGVKFRWLLGDTKRLIQVAVVVLKRKPSSGSGSAWREVAAYFRDFFPPCHDALWNWLDPVPALDELTEILQIVARSVIRGAVDILLPKRWIARLKKGSALGKKRAVRYLWLTAFGPKRNELTRLTPFVKRLVFVCHGNIIRSPMAEHLFRKHLEIAQNGDIDVASAGVACIPGNVADPRAVHIASEFGIDLTLHRTEPITQEMVRLTNLFVVMDYLNYVHLTEAYPDSRSKILFLGGCTQATQRMEIDDPYEGDERDVRECYQLLRERTRELATAILAMK